MKVAVCATKGCRCILVIVQQSLSSFLFCSILEMGIPKCFHNFTNFVTQFSLIIKTRTIVELMLNLYCNCSHFPLLWFTAAGRKNLQPIISKCHMPTLTSRCCVCVQRDAVLSEPAIQVRRRCRGKQIWSLEKMENRLVDMRELYQEWQDYNVHHQDNPVSPTVGF